MGGDVGRACRWRSRSPRARSAPRGRRGAAPSIGDRPADGRGADAGGRRRPAPRRASRASSTGSRSPGSTIAQSSGRPAAVLTATSDGLPAAAQGVGRRARRRRRGSLELEERGPRAVAADPERLQPPAQLLGAEVAAERLGEDVAGEPALGLADRALAHQLERDDHRRLPREQPLEIADLAAAPGERRASDPRGPRRRSAPGRRAPPGERSLRRRRTARRREQRERSATASPRSADAAAFEIPRSGGWRVSSRPWSSSSSAAPPTDSAIAWITSARPRSARTSRSSCAWTSIAALEHVELLVDEPLERLLGDRDERHLVGDLEDAEARSPRPPRPAPPAPRRGRSRCRSRARRASRSAEQPDELALLGARVVRLIPVVSSSSPPESHGVGSSSSEMWTQRISRSAAPASPAAARARARRGVSATVSTLGLGRLSWLWHLLPGLLEHRSQDPERSPRTARCRRSAAARAGSRGRRDRRRGRSARAR